MRSVVASHGPGSSPSRRNAAGDVAGRRSHSGGGRHHVACGAWPHACRNVCGAWRVMRQPVAHPVGETNSHRAPTSKHRSAADRAKIAREISSSGRPSLGLHCATSARINSKKLAAMRGRRASDRARLCARSTTGNKNPPSVCTRRADEFCHGWNLLKKTIGTSTITAVARRRRGGGREVVEGEGAALVRLEARVDVCSSYDCSPSTCVTLNGPGIQLAVGPQPLRLRNHNFGLAHRIMVKRLETASHDPLGITDSSCKNQLVMVSVQYGPFYTYIPIRSTTIGKESLEIR
ncbi:cleavage stimulation factor subunit 2-like [Dorcoceras hygrometricum]|uniref:Cleavage stimulation factor subunit 2-like n=1 Tax=Dorcoceras hygrometricum TaxID=472368 RepID=A0A2Z7A7V2_9LAMI|nr:cleavage stimulation factor subunit 2-like [Dorcoceras hygrometricum]